MRAWLGPRVSAEILDSPFPPTVQPCSPAILPPSILQLAVGPPYAWPFADQRATSLPGYVYSDFRDLSNLFMVDGL
jgi:hypothetical protein